MDLMRRMMSWLAESIFRLLEGMFTSGAQECDYLRRLSAVPPAQDAKDKRAA